MANDGEVIIQIDGDDSGFKKALSGLQKSGSAVAKVIAGSFAAAGSALSGVGIYAFKVGSDFEAAMSKVQAISGATGDELAQLEAKAKEMGATTKFSATESAEALQYMAMAGWKTEQMVDGLPGIMNLAAASGEDLASTSDIVTDALTAFGMQASESGRFADVLAAASSNANTNVSLMGETFKYVAPVAGALGYSAEDTAVAIGLMANAGIKGSQAGTALRGMLTNLAKPSDQVAGYMEKLGLSLTDASGQVKPLGALLGDLREKFAGLSEARKAEYAAGIAGQEGMSGLLALVNASDEDFNKLTDAINNSNGAAEEMAAVMNDNLQGSITIAKSGLEGLGISIYESMETPLKETVQTATNMIGQLQSAFNQGGLSGLVSEFGTVMADAITLLAEAAPQMIEAAGMLLRSFAEGIAGNSDQISAALVGVGEALVNGVIAIAPVLLSAAGQIVLSIGSAIAERGPQMVDAAAGLLQNLAAGISENLPALIAAGLDALSGFASGLRENLGILVGAGLSVITALGEGIIASIPTLIESVPQIVTDIAGIINDNAPKLIETAAELIAKLAIGLIQAIPTLVENIPQIIQAIVAVFMAFNWVNLGKTIIASLKNGIASMVSAVQGAAKNLLDAINSGLQALPSKLLSLGRDGVQGLLNGIKGMFGAIGSTMQSVGNAILSNVQALPSKLITVGKQIIQGLIDGIKSGIAGVTSAIGSLVTSAIDKAKAVAGIHSPSRVMREQVGRMLPMGMALGIEDGEPAVHAAIMLLSRRAFEIAKEEASDYKNLGTMYMDNLTYGIEAGRDAAIPRIVKWIEDDYAAFEKRLDDETDAIVKAKQAQIKKAGEAQKDALQAEIDQIKEDTSAKKKAYKEAGNEVASTYKTALTTGYDEALNAVKKKMTAITEEAQKQRDAVLKDQQAMQDKLAGFGDLFTVSDSGSLSLGNIEQNIKAVERYDAALTALSERGVSDEFMSKVTSLGVEEGTKFAEKLAQLPDSAFEKYMGAWQEQQELAKTVAEKFYADQLQTIDDEFTTKMEDALEDVPNMLDGVGKDSIQGMINGMYSKSGALSAAASEIVRRAISAMQAAADIHSPSGKTRDKIGKPLAEGIAVGFDKQMASVYRRINSTLQGEISRMSEVTKVQAERQAVQSGPAPVQTIYKSTHTDRVTKIGIDERNLSRFGRELLKVIKLEEKRTGPSMMKGGT